MCHATHATTDTFRLVYPKLARDDWAAFEKYMEFKVRQHNLNLFEECKKIFTFILSGNTGKCLTKQGRHSIQCRNWKMFSIKNVAAGVKHKRKRDFLKWHEVWPNPELGRTLCYEIQTLGKMLWFFKNRHCAIPNGCFLLNLKHTCMILTIRTQQLK